MQGLISDLELLMAAWDAQAQSFESSDMPASALAFRECRRRLGLVLASHVGTLGTRHSDADLISQKGCGRDAAQASREVSDHRSRVRQNQIVLLEFLKP